MFWLRNQVSFSKCFAYVIVCYLLSLVSAAFEGSQIDDCNFYWDEVLIPDCELVPLIKAKQFCGHFRISLKEKLFRDQSPKKEIPLLDEEVVCSDNDSEIGVDESTNQSTEHSNVFEVLPAHFLADQDPFDDLEDKVSEKPDDFLLAQAAKLREHFDSNVHTRILLLDDPTKPCNRKNIITCAVKYLFQECGLYPDVTQRSHLVKILVEVFQRFKPDEDLVLRWIHDKVSNLRKKMKKEEISFTKLLETNQKRKREDSDQESEGENNESSFSGIVVLNANKFKEYISSDIQTRLLLLDNHKEPSVRKSIISCSVKFLFNEVGLYPSLSQKRALIELVAEVFPGLKNEKENIKRWVGEKIKNFRKRTKQVENNYFQSLDRERILTGEMGSQEGIGYLESCTEIDDIPRIKKALQSTLTHRLEQYANIEFNVFHTYKFFGKSLNLVSFRTFLYLIQEIVMIGFPDIV